MLDTPYGGLQVYFSKILCKFTKFTAFTFFTHPSNLRTAVTAVDNIAPSPRRGGKGSLEAHHQSERSIIVT